MESQDAVSGTVYKPEGMFHTSSESRRRHPHQSSLPSPSNGHRKSLDQEMEENNIFVPTDPRRKHWRAARSAIKRWKVCILLSLLGVTIVCGFVFFQAVEKKERIFSADLRHEGYRISDRGNKAELVIEYIDLPVGFNRYATWKDYIHRWNGCKESREWVTEKEQGNCIVLGRHKIAKDVENVTREVRMRVRDVAKRLESMPSNSSFSTLSLYAREDESIRDSYPCACSIRLCQDADSQDRELYLQEGEIFTVINPRYESTSETTDKTLKASISLYWIDEMSDPFWMRFPPSIALEYLNHTTMKTERRILRDGENVVNFINCYHFMKSIKFDKWEF